MSEVSLSDSECFSTVIGKRALKKDVLSSGIPIYSANVKKPFGYVRKSNIEDFSKPALLWGIDGIFDWNYISPYAEFATTDHCGVLYVQHPKLDPLYIYYILRNTKDQYGFDRTYRASLKNIQDNITVTIPILDDGSFDMDAQQELAIKYQKLDQLRKTTIEQLGSLLAG